ncbi:hypothetical protein BU17DRAFT_40361 [Hysterangium stoloniferum]|nr:hypothetical protein BU17DRAFT_40361 [Hysterangium stoloniferum]
MSSFASKRAQREAKQSKSFVSSFASSLSPQIHDDSDKFEPPIGPSEESSCVELADLYADLPPSLEVRWRKLDGRGIWAKETIRKGSILLVQRPKISVLSTKNLTEHCSYCVAGSKNGPLKRCTKCKLIWYCSSECQNIDWSIHRHECSAISSWMTSASDGSPPGEAIRTLGRILWGRKVWGESSAWWKGIQALQSHRGTLPLAAVQSHTQLAHALVRYLGVTSPTELSPYGLNSAGDIVDLISRFTTNTFALTCPTLSPLGTCVSPIAALFNHSCDPNAVIVFPRPTAKRTASSSIPNAALEPRLHVIALKDIERGQEVLTSYIDTTVPTAQRQRTLKESYNFSCICTLCSNITGSLDPREAVLCPSSCGGLCSAPFTVEKDSNFVLWRCTSCKLPCTPAAIEDIEDKRRIGQDALDKATELQLSDPVRASKLTTNMIRLLGTHLPPSAHPLLGLLRLQQSLLIDTLSTAPNASIFVDETIQIAGRVVSGLTAVLSDGHPVRGVAMAELGKLLAMDEPASAGGVSGTVSSPVFPPTGPRRLALAVEMLKNALGELTTGFGEAISGGEAGNGVRETIVQLEREMNVWRQGIRHLREDTGAITKPK